MLICTVLHKVRIDEECFDSTSVPAWATLFVAEVPGSLISRPRCKVKEPGDPLGSVPALARDRHAEDAGRGVTRFDVHFSVEARVLVSVSDVQDFSVGGHKSRDAFVDGKSERATSIQPSCEHETLID